jgi:hypothetical protein
MASVAVHAVQAGQAAGLQSEHDPVTVRRIRPEVGIGLAVVEARAFPYSRAIGTHHHDVRGVRRMEVVRVLGHPDPATGGDQSCPRTTAGTGRCRGKRRGEGERRSPRPSPSSSETGEFPFINNRGLVARFADTAKPDPNHPDANVFHAFRWQGRTQLGPVSGRWAQVNIAEERGWVHKRFHDAINAADRDAGLGREDGDPAR